MKITKTQLKSLIKESVKEVMKEQKKGVDIKGHKNLTILSTISEGPDYTFNDLPEWFQKAKTKNAEVTLNDFGNIVWYNGEWKNGIWDGGRWKDGQWIDGTWKDGLWFDGQWGGGEWLGGTWIRGIWMGGIEGWLDKKNPHPNER